jgi:formylglycine-generating enzyme required for sulfatase activity
MVWVPGGKFRMGSEAAYAEERPQHLVEVSGFWMDKHPTTVADFARFVDETGYVSFAELPPNPADYPEAIPEMLFAGSLVFVKPRGPVGLHDIRGWWTLMRGAQWRHPSGAESTVSGREKHPVVHVAYCDVEAYAQWAHKELPTEAEWEFAARGGLDGATYAWGDELMPGGKPMANYWQGVFPHDAAGGWAGTSPVGSYPPNGYGLYDMIGNVWEWTADWYAPRHSTAASPGCCHPINPRGAMQLESVDQYSPAPSIPRKVLKGGSHLCSHNYCRRYRPAARSPQQVDSSTSNIGFRCIVRPKPSPA